MHLYNLHCLSLHSIASLSPKLKGEVRKTIILIYTSLVQQSQLLQWKIRIECLQTRNQYAIQQIVNKLIVHVIPIKYFPTKIKSLNNNNLFLFQKYCIILINQGLHIFSMLKSPAKIFPAKKSSINSIKTMMEPKQTQRVLKLQTSKSISSVQNDFSTTYFSKHPSINLLAVEVTVEKPTRIVKLAFSYSSQTLIRQLIAFLKVQLSDPYIYFKTKDLSIEYFLTLPHRKVIELETNKLELTANRIKIDRSGHYLNNLEIIKCLGTGGFSKVYLVRGYNKLMAMKVINKTFILNNEKQNIVQSQRNILQKCNKHPFITQLYLSFQTQHYLVFCMEYCNGGQLFNLLRKVRRMKESQAKFYFLQTLAAISHLHSQNILYRDLKPQNIIIDSQGHLRLADYGLSKIMRENMTYSFCGSAEYMAPQMLLKTGHGFQIDYYCLGALLYQLVIGLPPYYSRDQNQLFSNILNKQLQFPPAIPLSQNLKAMLRRLLQKNTDLRFKNIQEILSCPYLQDCNLADILAKKLYPPYKTNMLEDNFDNSDFLNDEEIQILKLQRQRDQGRLPQEQAYFPYFQYIDKELVQLDQQMQNNRLKRLNFTKKPNHLQQTSQRKQIKYPNDRSMKSIDSSQFYINQHQATHSPRLTSNYDKYKVFSSQTSQIMTQIIPNNPKASEIISIIKTKPNTPSKLIGARSLTQLQKVKSRHGYQRFGSPININNYINIYNSPPSRQFGGKINDYFSPQGKKDYGFCSFEKSINSNSSSSFKNSSNPNKPLISPSQSANNLYQNTASLNNRGGYLSNFKERFNPNQKIKKSYRTNDKLQFNFFTPKSPYKQI